MTTTTEKSAFQPTLRIPFTDKTIKELPPASPGKRRSILAEGEPHFLLRVTDKGSKTFYISRRPAGSTRPALVKLCQFKLDRHGRGNLAEARRLAVETLKQLDAGLNPTHEERRKARDRITFGEVAKAYIEQLSRRRLRQSRSVISCLHREFLGQKPRVERHFAKRERKVEWINGADPGWRNREISRLDRAAVRERLNAIAHRNLWAGRHAHASLRRLFSWAVEQELIQHSPIVGVRIQSMGIDKRLLRRRRVLSDAELRAVWHAAGKMKGSAAVYGALIRVLMLTGQRFSDWAKATWSEMHDDGDLQMLVVPGERYKNQEPHEVPITPKVRELLDQLPRFEGCDWYFSTTGKRPVCDFTRRKHQLDKLSGVSGYVLHDLRRSCRTNLGALGIPREVSERVIGHTLSSLEDVYDRGSYRGAKRAALTKWEAKLMEIVGETAPPTKLRLVEVREVA